MSGKRIPPRRHLFRLIRESLLARLVAVFFVFSTSIVALLGIRVYLLIAEETRATASRQLSTFADLCEQSLKRWVDDQVRGVTTMARLPDIRRACAALLRDEQGMDAASIHHGEVSSLFLPFAESRPEFAEILVLSQKGGLVVFSTDPLSEGRYRVTESAFVEGRTGLHVESVHPSADTLLPIMTIATPIVDERGTFAGVLMVNLNLDRMDRIIEVPSGLGRGGESYLVDRFHVFVSSRRFGRVDYPRGLQSTGISEATAGRNGAGVYLNYAGDRVIGAYRWVAGLQLALMVEIPVREALAAARRQAASMVVLGLLLVACLSTGVLFIGRRVTRPLIAVQHAAAQVASGALDAAAPVMTADEIGKLAISFNAMTARLRGMFEEVNLREEHFRTLIESSSDVIAVVDVDGRLLFASPSVQRVLGYDPAGLLGMDPFRVVHPADRQRVRAALLDPAARENGFPGVAPFRCRRADRTWCHLEASVRNMLTHPAVKGIVVNARDISERRRAEEQRFRLEDQLRQSQKMESIGRLAGGVAHDINNLLSPILGYTELILADLPPGDPRVGDLKQVQGAAERARDLMQQLLAFGRKQILTLTRLDLRDVVRGFETLLRRTIREDIRIALRLPSLLGAVMADAGRIEQVVMSLCVNAQDAMPEGGELLITLRDVAVSSGEERPGLQAGEFVSLSVSDTGRGMDRETRERLFEPFFTTKARGRGTGLGLSTAYGIIRQHGGVIMAMSEPGAGSTFEILIPRVPEAATQPPDGRTAEPSSSRGGETVLVVEDTATVLTLACRILERQGYRVLSAGSGRQALDIAEREHGQVDLLLTDVVMPGMNGRELYQRMADLCSGLRVLYMSGYTDDVIARHGVLEKGVSLIQKPFTIEDFARAVRRVLGAAGERGETR